MRFVFGSPDGVGIGIQMKLQKNFLQAFLLALLLAFLGVAHAQAPAQVQQATANPANRTDYVLGAGDVIKITVFQSPDLSVEARVSESGMVTFPLLGPIRLGGLTIGQAEKRVADGLREGNFVKQPQVSILVTQLRGNQASVLGQVNRPGRYPLELADTRLTDLLAMAGGIATTGGDVLTVVGTRAGKPFRVQIDFPTIFAGRNPAQDIVIQNNDVVYVDRVPMIYIYGEVQHPGTIRLERGLTVLQALASGGGLTPRGTEKGIRVHRRGADGNVQVLTPQMQDLLQQDDVVFVRESLF